MSRSPDPDTEFTSGVPGGVRRPSPIKKKYVSFYLMPVYMYPELLEGITPELRKRMQGKSCFNFKRVDESLFEELGALTSRGFEKFKSRNIE